MKAVTESHLFLPGSLPCAWHSAGVHYITIEEMAVIGISYEVLCALRSHFSVIVDLHDITYHVCFSTSTFYLQI